jgi:hypothetical protein
MQANAGKKPEEQKKYLETLSVPKRKADKFAKHPYMEGR